MARDGGHVGVVVFPTLKSTCCCTRQGHNFFPGTPGENLGNGAICGRFEPLLDNTAPLTAFGDYDIP